MKNRRLTVSLITGAILGIDKYYISYSIHEDINNFVVPASSVQ